MAGFYVFDMSPVINQKHYTDMNKNNFRFWVPLDTITKSKGKDGKITMKVGGLASTSTTDMDGESLESSGLDISYLKNKGIINWNHNKSPNAIIGEPTSATISKAGLHVECELYPDNDLAKQVYSLAETLEKNSKTRRLGFSIEGKATERDELDPTKVTKALVTNIALTISPKNPDSIVNIIKGNFNELGEDELKPYDLFNDEMETDLIKSIQTNIEKSASAGSQSGSEMINVPNTGASLKKESVDGVKNQVDNENEDDKENDKKKSTKTLTKAQVINSLMKNNSVISFEKANQIFETLNSISTMTNTTTTITDELLEKALSTLGIAPIGDDLNKGTKDEINKGAKDKEEDEVEEAEETSEESDEKPDFGKLKKSIDFNQSENIEMFRGIGTLLKGIYDKVDQVLTENAELKTANANIQKSLDDFGEQPSSTRKSVARPLNKSFEKGLGAEGEDLEKGANILSVSQNKNQVLNLLDVMTFEKGFDNEMSKAMTLFESSGQIGQLIQSRVKNEKGITLVK